MKIMDEIYRKISDRLRELEKREGQLSRFAKVYRELLHIQMEARVQAVVVRPNLGESRDRLREGIPLLLFEDFRPDWDQVETVCKQIIAWVAMDPEAPFEKGEDPRNIGSDLGFLREAAEAWYRGLSLQTLPVAQRFDVELLTSVVGATLKPFLSAYSRLLLPEVDQESWRRKVCPVCGGKPDFSSFREGGTRWLFCSRCDGEWLFSRIECPYCGTRNQEALAYFSPEEETSLYRLHVCAECHGYIKGIDLRGTEKEAMLPLERILTLDLDTWGQEKGFKPGWAIEQLREQQG